MNENFVREREKAVQAVKECGEEALLGGCLWHAVSLYEGTTFYTSKKLPFTYRIKGRELFCDRKEKIHYRGKPCFGLIKKDSGGAGGR